ncbi:cation diffusion facilitator family transporter [Rappaport israeli]|uniref:cation diffusion facilitator family transporter n=1 Tax=Rappaport israeli TaxID=1839807 RepID=UPI000B202D00|nr:cation transporter dimerization domain-containing protein [Rappaport israeli]
MASCSDALTSGAAFLGISLALFMGEGWESADDWAALFAAGIIYWNAYRIFRPTLGEMMDEDTHDEVREEVEGCVRQFAQVGEVLECLVRKHGRWYTVDLRVAVLSSMTVGDSCMVRREIKQAIEEKQPFISRIFIEITGDDVDCMA